MKASAKQLANALVAATADKSGKELAAAVNEFVAILAKNGLLHRWREIVRAVDPAWRERFGMANVRIDTAHELPKSLRDEIDKRAKGAAVRIHVAPELIGGARVRIDDRLIDGSVAGYLDRLSASLNE